MKNFELWIISDSILEHRGTKSTENEFLVSIFAKYINLEKILILVERHLNESKCAKNAICHSNFSKWTPLWAAYPFAYWNASRLAIERSNGKLARFESNHSAEMQSTICNFCLSNVTVVKFDFRGLLWLCFP